MQSIEFDLQKSKQKRFKCELKVTVTSVLSAVLLSAALLSTSAQAESVKEWGYSGQTGPEHWGDLNAENFSCSKGKNQSPIDISNLVGAELAEIDFRYNSPAKNIINNGHTIQVNFSTVNSINLNGHNFQLRQFHFHTPSENTIHGKSYPLEMHLVHQDEQGDLAVVAVMFDQGSQNQSLQTLWNNMPRKAGKKRKLTADF